MPAADDPEIDQHPLENTATGTYEGPLKKETHEPVPDTRAVCLAAESQAPKPQGSPGEGFPGPWQLARRPWALGNGQDGPPKIGDGFGSRAF
jgi:hypothetical protein